MTAIAKTTAKLAVSAALAILVTGMFGSAISVSATGKVSSPAARELHVAAPGKTCGESAAHHYG